jgi:hypothetical protein
VVLGRLPHAAVTTSIPLGGVDDDGDGLDRGQACHRRADQVRRAGRVDDVDALALVVGVQQREKIECLCSFSSFSKSLELLPVTGEPLWPTVLLSNSRASAREVFPHPPWPARAGTFFGCRQSYRSRWQQQQGA